MVEPTNDFEQAIINFCNQLADTLILKNREYGDSYRDSRQRFKLSHGDEKIPLIFHASEKVSRYGVCGSIDSVMDLAGYGVLEVVCRRLDDAENI